MDRIALEILRQELKEDDKILASAAESARLRLAEEHPGHLEACAFELNRVYNVLENAFERICRAFENHLEKRGNYHEEIIQRMTLDLPGIRPRFLPPAKEPIIRELKGFRHVIRHAYDLALLPDRMKAIVDHAVHVADEFPTWCASFVHQIEALLDTEN